MPSKLSEKPEAANINDDDVGYVVQNGTSLKFLFITLYNYIISKLDFVDDNFQIKNATDGTKVFNFDASQISTGTTRTLSVQNKNYVIADQSDVDGKLSASSDQRITTTYRGNTGALALCSGDEWSRLYQRTQIKFAFNTSGQYEHYIATRHYGGNPDYNAIDFYTCNGQTPATYPVRQVLGLTVNNGRIGVAKLAPTASIDTDDFTSLGESCPAFKIKKLTGTTAAAQGDNVAIASGIDPLKIISFTAQIQYSATGWIPVPYNNTNNLYEAVMSHSDGSFYIVNLPGSSSGILSKPLTITVFYEE